MKRVVLLIILIATTLWAKDLQIYFIGKYERLGSISNVGSTQKGVYLRWDMLEGDLPLEIDKIELIKEVNDVNKTLLSVRTSDIMSENEIKALFSKPYTQRSLYEIIEALSKNENPICANANINNFASKIRECIRNEKMWSFLASKTNFDIARVRYRAYLDKNVNDNQNITYYLIGKNIEGNKTITLGKVQVNTASSKSVLPPKNFKQIISSKCNDNRYGLDDFRVALSWQEGGNSKSDKFLNSLMVAGYDIYYSTKPVDKMPQNAQNYDIATLAKNLSHNSKGEVDLSSYGLKKANSSLITPKTQNDSNKPIYLETKKELIKRGFLPGEKRYYYLVVKDFTGNYGATKVLEVTVPDLLPPAKAISPMALENNESVKLIWQKPTLKNFAQYYKNSLKLCLDYSFAKVKRYKFVDLNENCSYDNGIDINFNIEKFYIYRFENFDNAAKFSDSDLDGFLDIDEENQNSNKCSANSMPLSAKNYLVGVVENNNSGDFAYFIDNNITKSQTYWYVIVSATSSKVISEPTAPIKAFVPKRGLLDAPKVKFKKIDGYKLNLEQNNNNLILVRDESLDVAKVILEIDNGSFNLDKNQNEFTIPASMLNLNIDGTKKGNLYFYDANSDLIYTYEFDISNLLLLTRGENGNILNSKYTAVLIKEGEYITKFTKTTNSCVKIEYEPNYLQELRNNNACIEISEFIGHKRYRTKRICNPTQNEKICNGALKNGDLISYRVVEVRGSTYSQPKYFNVLFIDKNSVPSVVNVSSLELNKQNQSAKVKFYYGLERVMSIYLNLYKKGDDNQTYNKIVSFVNSNEFKEYNVTFSNLDIKDKDTWCVRAKAVGINNKVSKWSVPVCKEISPISVNEDIMPWPVIKNNTLKDSAKEISFDNNKKRVLIKLLSFSPSSPDYELCEIAEAIHSIPKFVVYRQTIFNDGTKSNFVQVSPLVDTSKANCERGALKINEPNIDVSTAIDAQNYMHIYFVDRYPMIANNKYRYVILFLDERSKEVSSYAVTTPSVLQIP